jgi:hypothetical protein
LGHGFALILDSKPPLSMKMSLLPCFKIMNKFESKINEPHDAKLQFVLLLMFVRLTEL